ncbi:hypothetical protein MFIFM68171_09820 [Madurella fahalii]|uniref:Uncharacterized protein n=1 Tax=Madurella fahalii TaxID=1157608 RepID=A0ABQ0GPE8_9PEZI
MEATNDTNERDTQAQLDAELTARQELWLQGTDIRDVVAEEEARLSQEKRREKLQRQGIEVRDFAEGKRSPVAEEKAG